MTTMNSRPRAATTAEPVIPEYVCAEIWGGNRAVAAPIDLPGLRGRIISRPCAGGRGGDVHYVSICHSGLISRLCLADVAGHGEAVARTSNELHQLLRRYMNRFDERRILHDLNRRLLASRLGVMTTAAAVTYFPPMRTLTVSYAGHPPAWLYRRTEQRWTRLPTHGKEKRDTRLFDLPLAVDPQTRFSRRKVHVDTGDRLFLVTDGVYEAPDPQGAMLGEARVEAVLHAERLAAIDALAERVLAAVVAHTGGAGLSHDDVTLLALDFTEGPAAMGIWHMLKNRVLGRRRRT